MRNAKTIRGLLLGSLVFASPAMAQQAPDWLKPGPGRDATAASCATCHTPGYIRMNSVFLTPDQWKAEVTKMRNTFGAPIDDHTAREIIAYLGTNYAAPPK